MLETEEPRRLAGRAEIGRGTVGAVRWQIDAAGAGSRVTLSAEVVSATLLDRTLLALGGAWWLRRIFRDALAQLGRVA